MIWPSLPIIASTEVSCRPYYPLARGSPQISALIGADPIVPVELSRRSPTAAWLPALSVTGIQAEQSLRNIRFLTRMASVSRECPRYSMRMSTSTGRHQKIGLGLGTAPR